MEKTYTCIHCGKEFTAKKSNARFCSKSHCVLWHRNNKIKILTPLVVTKLENLFQEHLHTENGESFFGLKQKEMMSEIEDIIGIECYE